MTNNNDNRAGETLEGNKLIAGFIGPTYTSTFTGKGRITLYCKYDSAHPHCEAHELEYHTSWDWLMPVVEKICRMKIGDGVTYIAHADLRTFGMMNEDTGQIMVRLNAFPLHQADTLIEATWNAVVDFIRCHNQQSTPTNKEQPEQTPAP